MTSDRSEQQTNGSAELDDRPRRLTLGRRAGQTIVVDGPATFKVDEVRGRHVRLSVEANDDVTILRGELVGTPPRAA